MTILSILTNDGSVSPQPPSDDEMRRMGELIAEFKRDGVLIDTGGRMPDMFELKVSRTNGNTTIVDGPFTETKELVGGFALMNVRDRDQAIEVTNRFLELVGHGTCHLHEVEIA